MDDKVSAAIIMIIAIFVLAVLAGISPGFGKVAMVFMGGLVVVWLIAGPGAADIQSWFGKLKNQ